MSALDLRNLRISFGPRTVVDGVDLTVEPGECVAVVGESGAGKSLTALALLGLTPPGARVGADRLEIDGVDLRRAGERAWREVRGDRIALVSQDALVSLDPLARIGAEVAEPLEIHTRLDRRQRAQRVHELLLRVGMPHPDRRVRQRPHELSGGLRQRALIASALAAAPRVLVADEPTTALDATVQARVLGLLRSLVDEGVGLLLISHDLTAVARVADRIIVMRNGRVVETGPAAQVLRDPQHPYTRELVDGTTIPPAESPAGGAVVLAADGLHKTFRGSTAVDDVTFTVRAGRSLGIVGESGAGKSTVARLLLGVETPDRGTVCFDDAPWNPAREQDRRPRRPRIQLVHQDTRAAFDPRWTIGRSLREALAAGGVPAGRHAARTADLLQLVELDPELAGRRPGQLSGGQRQRAAIARALATQPDVLVLDEPVSALDVSVQRRVLELLARLRRELRLTTVLISHDLAVVRGLADDVLVMKDGRVVERGVTTDVFDRPQHPFTIELVAASARSDRIT
ncbi:dipeptide ABC transporter ATP-binding protein [Microbacterium sp. NPDC055910]|uniref:dipeptide ABC transporter ATP-binding protein n=1 Tax=Microbacterium sp. NPDC055910 TaxID=3345659 RepID=UPI0035DF8563